MGTFMEALKGLFGSKKFQTFLVGLLAVIVGKLGWNLDEETLWMVVVLVASFITGQGVADFGKEAAKIKSES